MNRQFDAAVDGDPDILARQKFRVIDAQRLCGWSCDRTSPHFKRDMDMCPAQCLNGFLGMGNAMSNTTSASLTGESGGTDQGRINNRAATKAMSKRLQGDSLAKACEGKPRAPFVQAADLSPAHCGDTGLALLKKGVMLLVGVMTGPTHEDRRTAIRNTWKRWGSARVLVCFVLGRRGLQPTQLQSLDAESALHRDVIFLPDVTDEGVPTLKGYAWWTHAASLLAPRGAHGIRHVAKVDDDSFVHLPNLEADLDLLRCEPNVYYGHLAYTGYDPTKWRLCGWSWQSGGGNYKKERCARRGAHPIFPFVNGALELLSAPLLRFVATSPEVREFVQIATRAIEARKSEGYAMGLRNRGPRVWRQNEDVALGFWLHHGQRQHRFNVTYVKINDRAPNMACISTKGMYQRPRNDTVVVHFLKRPAGMAYVWGVLHDGVAHDSEKCTRYVWHNNCESDDAKSKFCRAGAQQRLRK